LERNKKNRMEAEKSERTNLIEAKRQKGEDEMARKKRREVGWLVGRACARAYCVFVRA
jgi:hypothetical protein